MDADMYDWAGDVIEQKNAEIKSLSSRNRELEDRVLALTLALRMIVEEKCDYMRINNLGNPETQRTIKVARKALSSSDLGASIRREIEGKAYDAGASIRREIEGKAYDAGAKSILKGQAMADYFAPEAQRQWRVHIEREAIERCAKVAEEFSHPNPFPTVMGAIAAAIRALLLTRESEQAAHEALVALERRM